MKDVHHWIGKYIVKYIWDFFFFDSNSRILQGQKIRTLRFSLLLVQLSSIVAEGLGWSSRAKKWTESGEMFRKATVTKKTSKST